MVVRFRKKKTEEWLVLFVLVMPFTFAMLFEFLRVPDLLKYIVDVAWVLLLLRMLSRRHGFLEASVKPMLIMAALFFVVGLVGFLTNYQSGFYFLWGMRNNARFFVFFFACILYLKGDAETYLRAFDALLWINVPLVIYQYFVLGKAGDYLGGLFGTGKGCNGYINIFLCIVAVRSLVRYMKKQENLVYCFMKCGAMLLIATLAELKAFVLELAIIVVMTSLQSHFTMRKLWIALGTIVGVVITANAIAELFPDFADWFNLERIINILGDDSGYTASEDLNRLNGVAIVWNRFLPSVWHKLFGLGLGNCDYATGFEFLTTPFYMQYGRLHYMFFSSAVLMLETGLIGTLLYVGFFVAVFLGARKLRRQKRADDTLCQMAQILAVLCVVTIIYNSSMRSECAFMMYFVLALPFASTKT